MELISPAYVNIIAIIAIVTGLAIGAWWIIALYWLNTREVEGRYRQVELPADLKEVLAGVPPAATIFYIFTAITLIAYVLYCSFAGVSF